MSEEIEAAYKRAFDALEVLGVPKERARSVSNGIEVLAARFRKSDRAQSARIAALEAELAAERARADVLLAALNAIMIEPYGCRFCDSGKLRKPGDPAKDHDDDCGFLLARAAIANEQETT